MDPHENIVNFRQKYFNEEDNAETLSNYSRLADEYDEDLLTIGSQAAFHAARVTSTLIKQSPSSGRVLDVACGTGRVGLYLRNEFGFQGQLDGVDGSDEMLDKARTKSAYTSLIKEVITQGKESSFVREKYYDVVVCCGGFCMGHLHPDSLPDLLRSVKIGGHVVLVIGVKDQSSSYGTMLMDKIMEMETICSNNKIGESKMKGVCEAVIWCLTKL